MGKNSKIDWTDHTFNPWMGCAKVSPGCVNCYAERDMDTHWHKVQWGPQGTRVRTSKAIWKQPLRWNKETWRECLDCGRRGIVGNGEPFYLCPICMTRNNVPTRQRVFCASLADVFEDRPDVFFWRDDLFRLIEQTPNLDWLLLTKRPENIKRTLPDNVWIGVSVENQAMADKRIPVLLTVPAKIRFLSCEPLLGSLDLPVLMRDNLGTWNERINWVIAGGESGPEARPMDPRWMRSLRDQCQVAAVPFFFKQWGEYAPFDQLAWATDETMFKHRPVDINGSMMCRVGKGKAGHILDGCEWREIPH